MAIGKPEKLLRRRPDIHLAERSLAAATAQIGIFTADLFPRVVFLGNVALELLEDQDRLAQSETDTALALVAVYKALGGGWEMASPDAKAASFQRL